ncbi:MAG: RICIN domain-containing protein, partial [Ruminococcus sp.]|nr:RICIN domain-containing protein [Ruminococcus sp.]
MISEETTSPMLIKNPSVNILSAKEASSTENIGKGASGNFFENKPVDLVFAIQNSGFGEKAKQKFEFEKTLIRDISNYAFKNYKDVRVHLVAYNIQWDIQNASIDGMPFFLDINQVEKALDKIEYIPNLGVSNRALGHYLAFVNAGRLSYRQNAERFIYNFTNYSTYFQDAFGNYSYDFQSVYDYFWRNDMHYSQVIEGGNNFDSFLNELINGDYSDPRCDSSILPNLIGHDGVDLALDITTENNYNDIIKSLNQHIEKTSLYGAYSPIDWKKKILSAELAEDKPFDTDSDTVPDWEEIDKSKLIMYEDGSFDLPTINDFINLIANENERKSVLNFLYGNMPVLSSESHTYSASSKRSSSMADAVLGLKVLPTVSDPTSADSDKDGYTDVDDPEPYNPPKYLDGKYDFLDGEIYLILYKESNKNMYCFELSGGSISNGTPIVQTSCDGTEKQRFRFKWYENEGGYTIHPISNELMILTLNTSSFEVRLTTYTRTNIFENQIWEVIPCENSTNVVIRSKYIDSNDSLAKSYYLSLDESSNALICKTDKKQKFNISNPTYN